MLNTEQVVKNALASTLNFSNTDSIALSHHLRNDFQLDSMGTLMFLMKLEELIDEFYVDPETLETRDLETVSSIVNYINMQMFSKNMTVH
ncbi:MAG: hypothetical protein A3F13_06160 [Gammaproteobacteria bacterium RIFCSPHIGHO2_12_FULL_40_19]|nr:MAG: hypothetical protein A3F13_06160 [Gammaproteobacteria bacterium RIFCSPHIGHO2_12_FULL_40_19]